MDLKLILTFDTIGACFCFKRLYIIEKEMDDLVYSVQSNGEIIGLVREQQMLELDKIQGLLEKVDLIQNHQIIELKRIGEIAQKVEGQLFLEGKTQILSNYPSANQLLNGLEVPLDLLKNIDIEHIKPHAVTALTASGSLDMEQADALCTVLSPTLNRPHGHSHRPSSQASQAFSQA